MLYDTIIIGGGPAAIGAAVYVARKQLRSLLLAETIGGQSIVSDDIQNWVGEPHISGVDLAKKMETHARSYPDVLDVRDGVRVATVAEVSCDQDRLCDFEVRTNAGESFRTKTVIVASGARRRKLGIPGEDTFNGRGVAYCSTCDAPLFKGKAVAVVGGGNAGLEAVEDLFPFASRVYLLEFSTTLKGDSKTQAAIQKNDKLTVLLDVEAREVVGEQFVTGLRIRHHRSNTEEVLPVQGVFVEIGSVPNSEVVQGLVRVDPHGQIITDMKYATTSHPGVFAAGDVTDDPFKQNNISVGDGVRAGLSAHAYILRRRKSSPAADTARHGE